MSNEIDKKNLYRKRKCDFCGAFAFEKYMKELASLDGGFTKVNEWEKSGFGSIVVSYWGVEDVKEGRFEYNLCPDCAKKLDSYIHSKIEELKVVDEEIDCEE